VLTVYAASIYALKFEKKPFSEVFFALEISELGRWGNLTPNGCQSEMAAISFCGFIRFHFGLLTVYGRKLRNSQIVSLHFFFE